MSRDFWTPEEVEILRAMAEKGCSITDMHRVFPKREVDAIYHKLYRMGVKRKPQVVIDYEEYARIMREMEDPTCL